jgi:hypothetical protein
LMPWYASEPIFPQHVGIIGIASSVRQQREALGA